MVSVPYQRMTESTSAEPVDLIVMATHGHTGSRPLVLGSVAWRMVGAVPGAHHPVAVGSCGRLAHQCNYRPAAHLVTAIGLANGLAPPGPSAGMMPMPTAVGGCCACAGRLRWGFVQPKPGTVSVNYGSVSPGQPTATGDQGPLLRPCMRLCRLVARGEDRPSSFPCDTSPCNGGGLWSPLDNYAMMEHARCRHEPNILQNVGDLCRMS
jgi:hypothetical protein